MNWYLWGFDCNSLMTDNVEHLVVCLLTICVSSLNKYLFKFFAHLKNGIFAFYYWVMFFIYYEYKSFIRYIISKSFPPFYELSFHTVDGVLWRIQIFFIFIKSNLFFSFVPCDFCVISKKPLPNPRLQRCIPMHVSESFTLLDIMSRSLIHFE